MKGMMPGMPKMKGMSPTKATKGRDRIKPVRIKKGFPNVKSRISRKMTTFGFGSAR